MAELSHKKAYFWPFVESIKFISFDNLEPEENLLCLMYCAKKQGMGIVCVFKGNGKYWPFNTEKPQGHIRNPAAKRGRAYLASLPISYIETPGGEYDLTLT